MTSEALLVFDRTAGTLSYVNAEAAALFGLRDDRLGRVRAADLLPALHDLTPRRFTAHLETISGPRDVLVRLQELRAGPFAPVSAVAVTIAALPAARPEQRNERLEALWDLVVRQGFAGPDQIYAILRESVRGIELERATVARFDGQDLRGIYTDAGPWSEAAYPLETEAATGALVSGTFAVSDTLDVPGLATASTTRCVLAARFVVNDERYVLTFTSPRPREAPFTADDWCYVETVLETLSRGVERLASDAFIEGLAYSDALTSLPNRIALLRRIDDALLECDRLSGRTAILFLDIDGFKTVNDTVGHRGGDTVLAEIAQRLRGTLRRQEYIGRFGGDEFAVVMPSIADRHEVEKIALRLTSVLTFPFRFDEYRFALSVSIGIALYPDDALARDDLLACADAAMYSAKADGGSRVRFCDEIARNSPDGVSHVSPASSALAEPFEQSFVLCYQPILDVRSGLVTSAEALVRRVHPVHGLLAPERGRSIARDDAARRALDRWVLREAAAQARAWHEAGTPLKVDVNLASFDAWGIDVLLADDSIARHGNLLRVALSPDQFGEAASAGILASFVTYCATLGIGFVLDDFDGRLGMLGALAHVPLGCVKLQRPLGESILLPGPGRAIVQATTSVAKSVGWNVIAKGVENVQQQEALVSLGCDGIQGFYVAHPMTAVDFSAWVGTHGLVGREA